MLRRSGSASTSEWAKENPDALDLLYPDPEEQPVRYGKEGSRQLDEIRRFCSDVTWSLTPERGYGSIVSTEHGDLLPVEKYLLEFFSEATTSGTFLHQYFRVLRARFHNEAEDKVLLGLLEWLDLRGK